MRGRDVWAVESATRPYGTPLLGSGSEHGVAPCTVRVGEDKGTGWGGFEPAKALVRGLAATTTVALPGPFAALDPN